MYPHRRHVQEDNVDSWLMSYADMITLLLCFFIIFVSVSEPRKERLTAITDGMAGKFGTVDLSTPFQGVFHSMQAVVENHQLFTDVGITKTDRGLEVEMSSGSFFQPNNAELIEEKLPVLVEFAEALKKIDYADYVILVEGHTSNEELRSSIYPTNWELSSARASRVVRFLIDQGVKRDRLRAMGLADTKPLVPNEDARARPILENRAKNQRIVIRVEQRL